MGMVTLGVVGTMVWDTIWRRSDVASPVEEWGGISYALAAADALDSRRLRVRPCIKLGRDLAERGFRFLRGLSVIETHEAVRIVPEPNPRVELRYEEAERRMERLWGSVTTWSWEELGPLITGCDALYVNFITGRELDLRCAQLLRASFDGPIYTDLHSLLLAIGPGGERSPRPLARWSDWLRCFDAVQLNEDELRILCAQWGDPWAFAADIVGRDTGLLLVTLGGAGAAYVMMPDALPLGRATRRSLHVGSSGPVRTGRIAAEPVSVSDPTGCGDVWGMTACAALLGGRDIEEAIREANAVAARNASHRGTSGLSRFLRCEIERP